MSTPGRTSVGRYELRTRLGAGGMGTVWHAWDPALQRDVAVKEVLLPQGMSDEKRAEAHARTLREAQATARISHTAVVTIHDVLEHDASPWIVMELLSGASLQHHLDTEGPLPVARVEQAARSLLGGLKAAHAAGVTHRDVKPANIMFTEDDRTVLTDFGIANVDGSTALTQTGVYIGSPEYMAPERFEGERALPASDLWSLGVTLYSLLEGRSPFKRDSITGMISAVLTAPMPPQLSRNGYAQDPRSLALRALIAALLTREVSARPSPQQALELLERECRAAQRQAGTHRGPLPELGTSPRPGAGAGAGASPGPGHSGPQQPHPQQPPVPGGTGHVRPGSDATGPHAPAAHTRAPHTFGPHTPVPHTPAPHAHGQNTPSPYGDATGWGQLQQAQAAPAGPPAAPPQPQPPQQQVQPQVQPHPQTRPQSQPQARPQPRPPQLPLSGPQQPQTGYQRPVGATLSGNTGGTGFAPGVGHTGTTPGAVAAPVGTRPGKPPANAPSAVLAAMVMLGINALVLFVVTALSAGRVDATADGTGWGSVVLLGLWGVLSAFGSFGLLTRSRLVYALVVLVQGLAAVSLAMSMFVVFIYTPELLVVYALMLLYTLGVGALLLIPGTSRSYFGLG